MKIMKYLLFVSVLFSFVLGIYGCNINNYNTGKKVIVTTLFPLYDFTRQIAGDKMNVKLILPPGVEPHAYDPSVRDIFTIKSADLFIYTGNFMEPWAARLVKTMDKKEMVLVASNNITLLTNSEENHEPDESEYDPHIWLDPLNALIISENIMNSLIALDKDNESFYRDNFNEYKAQLLSLHNDFLNLFSNTKYHTIIYGGHFVFAYLAKEYNLDFVSPYNGFGPEAEPTPGKIQELIKVMKSTGQNTIYYEELIDPKVSRVISEQTGADMLLLNGAHNVSKQDLQNGVTYIEIMKQNLENLKIGLGYHE